ncbi:FAD/NAD(P)-binding domain-containing protein [Leucosporidium creatinivorum]|uniref:FAD/NAD(P)-binding domain-containing protein n=1 Tax=Leucosporidium creatinivorum TaxID=106004 RepID=A0A1Y2FCZ3_9BASI|nr:FAD/NAD(P)-binding domain-containing protein [Leucosporidium creatinivorum]
MVSLNIDPSTGRPINVEAKPFKLEDHPVDDSGRRLKVAVIGAGFAGIIAGIRIDQRLRNVDLDIYEKNNGIGGTWLENDYPGLACDIPAHAYHLTFEPNLSWSAFYATGREILSYLTRVVDKYQLMRFIRLRHLLTGAEWNEEKGQWTLSFDLLDEAGSKVGETTKVADVVLQGMGGLNRWNWPDIEGIHDFKGRLLHSAKYDEAPEGAKGKRVAVIGSGSSAIQIVPALQPFAKQLDQYVRGSAWVAAPFASSELLKRSPNGTNHKFTDEELARFRDDTEFYNEFRHAQEAELNCLHHLTFHGSAGQVAAVAEFKEAMSAKLAKKPEIAERLIPTFPVACRRLTPGPGYLEALVEDNVDFRPVDIKRVTATGIEGSDGEHREYDSIVCATGFDSTYRPRVPIIGRNGKNVQDVWSDIPTNYLSMAIGPEFPNYFMINGPNSATGAGSLVIILEREVDYLVEALAKIQRENIKAMAVKQGAVDDFMSYVANYFPATVFGQPCRSWYKAGKLIGPVVALWPGSCLHAVKTFKHPRWEDYEYVSANKEHENRLGWLGNGWTEEDVDGDTAFYLKEVNYPPVPLKVEV